MNISENFDIEKFQQEVFSEIPKIESILDSHHFSKSGSQQNTKIRHERIPPSDKKLERKISILISSFFPEPLIIGLLNSIAIVLAINLGLGYISTIKELLIIFPIILILSTSVVAVASAIKKHLDRERWRLLIAQRAAADARKRREKEEEAKKRLARIAEAEQISQDPNIKKLLCPALLSLTSDAHEHSKVIVPLLITGIIAKTVFIPLDSILIAALAIVIARSGVASYCVDYSNAKK